MQLLRKISTFGAPLSDMKHTYIVFIRSLLEQSCVVWHSGLTAEQCADLERVQKSALRIMLQEKYENYQNALNILQMDTLFQRREFLTLNYAKKCITHPKMKHLFPPNNRTHPMNVRKYEKFQVTHANTERFKNSPILYMQKLLNSEYNT